MDHMYGAFQAVSGVDLGHTLLSSVAVKLSVFRAVTNGMVGFNCDGKGFNENHSWKDMKAVYDACRAVMAGSEGGEGYQELMQAIDKYIESLKQRTVILPKESGIREAIKFVINHTLFSGEATTQLVNTMIIGGIAAYAVSWCNASGLIMIVWLFFKGDDLNGFCRNWLEAVIVLGHAEEAGMVMEKTKDHIEPGQSEHERCIVTAYGYAGSLARRVGSAVAREPQGSRALTFEEMIESVGEMHQSLVCRGGQVEAVTAFTKAVMMTHMREARIKTSTWQAMGRPKCIEGLGIWDLGSRYIQPTKELPRVLTKVRLYRTDGKFAEFGSAKMTDVLIEDIARDNGVSVQFLSEERDEMVADAIESGLGPEKFGERRMTNTQAIVSRLQRLNWREQRDFELTGSSMKMALEISRGLEKVINDERLMRTITLITPSEIIEQQLSRSGCVNKSIYKKVHNIPKKDDDMYIKRLRDSVTAREWTPIVSGLNKLEWREQRWFYEGKFGIAFYGAEEKINKEVAAFVRTYVLMEVAKSGVRLKLEARRDISAQLEWEYCLVDVAKVVWNRNKAVLSNISY
jgi:hypothetical protein